MPRVAVVLASALTLATQGVMGRARAAAPARTASLSWERGPGATACPDAAALAGAVETRLARPVFVSPAAAEAAVAGRIDRAGARAWNITLTLTDRAGQPLGFRDLRLEAGACDELTPALALVIAVMLDPDAPTRPAPAAPVPAPAPPVPAPPPPPPWRLGGEAGAVAVMGVLPGIGFGASAGATVHPPRGPLLAALLVLAPPVPAAVRPGVEGRFGLISVAVGACPLAATSALASVRACASLEGGRIGFAGVGFDQSQGGGRYYGAVGAGVRGDLRLWGALRVFLDATGGIPIRRERFFFVEPGETRRDVHAMSAVIARITAGLALGR